MKYLKITAGIFLVLAASRFIPHPPNFTSLLALSFYIPALLGIKFIPALVLCYIITDLFIGLHSTLIFTWGSVIVIGFISKYFASSLLTRLAGSLVGVLLFYIITNFGVWTGGSYGYDFYGLIECYTMGLPFLGNSLISTLIFASLIETVIKFSKIKIYNISN